MTLAPNFLQDFVEDARLVPRPPFGAHGGERTAPRTAALAKYDAISRLVHSGLGGRTRILVAADGFAIVSEHRGPAAWSPIALILSFGGIVVGAGASYVVLIVQVFGALDGLPVAISATAAFGFTGLAMFTYQLVRSLWPQMPSAWIDYIWPVPARLTGG